MVFAKDSQWFFPLHQGEEVISHRLAIEEIVNAKQEVPEWGEGERTGDRDRQRSYSNGWYFLFASNTLDFMGKPSKFELHFIHSRC